MELTDRDWRHIGVNAKPKQQRILHLANLAYMILLYKAMLLKLT